MPLGKYVGKALVEMLDDGRRVKLASPFAYIDPRRRRWDVPKNAIVDGASIPRMLWTLIGGPFEGKYRNASIIHDWYCDTRLENWKLVHRMFFDAMITSSVPVIMAKTLYAGVYLGGPKWSKTVVENTRLATNYGLPGRKYRSSQKDNARVKFAKKAATSIMRRPAKTVTVVRKYQMRKADLQWLNDRIQDPDQSLSSIERMVDHRLATRIPRMRTV